MKISTFPEDWANKKQKAKWLDSFAKRSFFGLLTNLQHGHLVINQDGRSWEFGDKQSDLRADIQVSRSAFYRMALLHGSIGAAEAYMSGCWHSRNLTRVIQLFCRNMDQLQAMDSGLATIFRFLDRMQQRLLPNSLSGAEKNIQAHYDIGNELFKTFLDKRLMYSSAIFNQPEDSIDVAQELKLKTIAKSLDLHSQDRVVEIGTGWGGLAIYLAENYGCHVTTTTISQQQFEYANNLIKQKKLENRITILDKDYRLLDGQFDKLVSIEMIEAVGHRYFSEFFAKCDSLIRPGGKMLIQAITIPEQRYDNAKKNVDFIQRYIFPGGCLPSLEAILSNTGKHSRLQLEQLNDIGLDYARTLAIWRERFVDAKQTVRGLGYDDVFNRLWEYYLCYCEGGFRERSISTVQALFRRV